MEKEHQTIALNFGKLVLLANNIANTISDHFLTNVLSKAALQKNVKETNRFELGTNNPLPSAIDGLTEGVKDTIIHYGILTLFIAVIGMPDIPTIPNDIETNLKWITVVPLFLYYSTHFVLSWSYLPSYLQYCRHNNQKKLKNLARIVRIALPLDIKENPQLPCSYLVSELKRGEEQLEKIRHGLGWRVYISHFLPTRQEAQIIAKGGDLSALHILNLLDVFEEMLELDYLTTQKLEAEERYTTTQEDINLQQNTIENLRQKIEQTSQYLRSEKVHKLLGLEHYIGEDISEYVIDELGPYLSYYHTLRPKISRNARRQLESLQKIIEQKQRPLTKQQR